MILTKVVSFNLTLGCLRLTPTSECLVERAYNKNDLMIKISGKILIGSSFIFGGQVKSN